MESLTEDMVQAAEAIIEEVSPCPLNTQLLHVSSDLGLPTWPTHVHHLLIAHIQHVVLVLPWNIYFYVEHERRRKDRDDRKFERIIA